MFNYNKDKPISIQLKDHSKQIALHTSDGSKAHKKKLIDFVRTNVFAMTQKATGLITRDFVLEEFIKNKLILTKDINDLPHEVNQFIKTKKY